MTAGPFFRVLDFGVLEKELYESSKMPGMLLGYGLEPTPNREEKTLRHVVMVAKFLDDTKPKIHLKSIFALFQTSSILFSLI